MRFPVFLLMFTGLLWASSRSAQAQRRLTYRDWKLVFIDDFDTYRDVADMAVRGPWRFLPDAYRTLVNNPYELQYYDSTGVELHNGDLHLVARPLPEPLRYRFTLAGRDTSKLLSYSSGWITLKLDYPTNPALGDTARWPGNRGFQYGLFEIRCKVSSGTGLFPAFWLYSGPTEIDVFEGENARQSSNNMHYLPADTIRHRVLQQRYNYTRLLDLAQDFHTYSVVWTAEAVSFYLDRRLLRTVPATQVPTYPAPLTIIANQAVVTTVNPGTWPDPSRAPLIIDYIKVYKPRGD